ncbi:hypothetical protein ALC60_11186 [Trachymyrmex zeteki]|uniref:Uncharacterized protein n=1 Tax=Mycetomoellerius zeteki TaxID=64791 RepID=A0A151WPK9_9HYME|nr:hypothetical protein ALC60_11186 [Trachymyrmex zeteki]
MTLTRPRLPPISKLLAISSNELAAILATTSSVSVTCFRLIEVTIHMPLKGGLQMNDSLMHCNRKSLREKRSQKIRISNPVVGRSFSVQEQTALVATAERHEGNRLETTSGGHEEIASLPSNDVTTNANLITGPDIANRPGPVAVVDEEKERKKRDARMPRHAIDITQTVALNDYDTGTLLQVQEWRFRIVRPTGNPDEPLRFRHASPQGEELPAGARRCYKRFRYIIELIYRNKVNIFFIVLYLL